MRLKTSLIYFALHLMLVPLMAQQQIVNLRMENSSLAALFKELNKQTGLDFIYSEEQAKRIQPISIKASNEKLETVLHRLFKNTKYTFKSNKGVIQIIEKKLNETRDDKKIWTRGVIHDEKGKTVPRSTIRLSGIEKPFQSDDLGRFNIPQNSGSMQITSIGFKPKTVQLNGEDNLNITLQSETNTLDETLVVAYGTSTKREQTGAISVVTAKEIEGIPAANIGNLLQGRVAGMDVTNMSGSPGSGGTAIVIRGYNSLDVEQERRYSSPLWVIDGVPMNTFTSPVTGTNLLSDLNPDMIESVQVLKDASAAAIYGSRAANGVILVTTKKGKNNQKAVFSFNGSQSVSILPELPTVSLGAFERNFRTAAFRNFSETYIDQETNFLKFVNSYKESYEKGFLYDANWSPHPIDITGNGGGVYQDSLNNFYNNSTNFFPLFFKPARVTNTNFQSYGGTENINYGIGMGYYNEEGILKGTGFNRIDFNTKIQATPIKRATVDAFINLTTGRRKRGTPSQSIGLKAAPLIETIPGDPLELSSLYPGEGSIMWTNILDKLSGSKENNRSMRMRGNLRIGYDILKDLNFTTSGALDYSIERRNYFLPTYLDPDLKSRNMTLGEQGINLMGLMENLLTYKKTWDDHSFTALLGQSLQYDQSEFNGGHAKNTPSDLVWYASSTLPQYTKDIYGDSESIVPLQRYMSDMWEKKLISWFGRIEYNFKKKYLISAALRKDGSSVFGRNNKWGTFPSIGTGYNFSDDLKWEPLNYGKIRASWGRSGLQFYSPYLALGILIPGESFEGSSTLQPVWQDGLYNESLSWERTDQYDIGIDLELFNSRLTLTTDYFYRYTDNLLDKVPLAAGYNTYQSQWRNAAAISNEGLELLIRYEIMRRPDTYWKVAINGAHIWNKFAKSYGNYAETIYNYGNVGRILGKPLNGIMAIPTNGIVQTIDELPKYYYSSGLGSYFALGAPYKAGDWNVDDVDGNGSVGAGDYVYVGSALPTISGGITNEFKYKKWDLNFLFSYQFGRHIMNLLPGKTLGTNASSPTHALLININDVTLWNQEGDVANFPQNKLETLEKPSFSLPVNNYVRKINWVKLKSVVLGYKFNLSKHSMNQLKLFLSGENLLNFNNYSGIDPEVVDLSTGIDNGISYPLARKITFGLTLNL